MPQEVTHWYPVGRAVVLAMATLCFGFIIMLIATVALLGPPKAFAGSSFWRIVVWHFGVYQLPLLVGGLLAAPVARWSVGGPSRVAFWALAATFGLVFLVMVVPFFIKPTPNFAVNGPVQLLVFAVVLLMVRRLLWPRSERPE
jgi:hypothetical protein